MDNASLNSAFDSWIHHFNLNPFAAHSDLNHWFSLPLLLLLLLLLAVEEIPLLGCWGLHLHIHEFGGSAGSHPLSTWPSFLSIALVRGKESTWGFPHEKSLPLMTAEPRIAWAWREGCPSSLNALSLLLKKKNKNKGTVMCLYLYSCCFPGYLTLFPLCHLNTCMYLNERLQ